MHILDRYIWSHFLRSTFVVVLALVGLLSLVILLDQLGEVDDNYGLSQALTYMIYKVPGLTYQLFPISMMLGALISLGSLASSSELVAIRTSGVSIIRIISALMVPVVSISLVALLLAQFLVPFAEERAEQLKASNQTKSSTQDFSVGKWVKQDNTFLHIAGAGGSGDLYGITRYDFNAEKQLQALSFAKQARYEPVSKVWVLSSVQTTLITENSTQAVVNESVSWDLSLTPEFIQTVLYKVDNLSLTGLLKYSRFLAQQGLDTATFMLSFWSKLFQPLAAISLVIIGAAFVFGPLRSVTVGQRTITGIVVGLLFKFSQELIAPTSQIVGFPPVLAALIPILISLMVGLWLLARVR